MSRSLSLRKGVEGEEENVDSHPSCNKVLIIDNDVVIKGMLEKILHNNGYTTTHATNRRDALRLIEVNPPDTILITIEMSGTSSIELCRNIRDMPLKNRPSIIMLSSADNRESVVEVLKNGADDFIIKPFDEMELILRIQAHSRMVSSYRILEKKNRELELIRDITNTVTQSLDSGEILYSIVKKTADFIGADRCSIVLINKNDEAYIVASHESPTIRNLKIDLKKHPELKRTLVTQEPMIIEAMGSEPLLYGVRRHIQEIVNDSLLVVPILRNEEMLGTLLLRTRRSNDSFTRDELNLCEIIANSACHPLKKAKIFEELTAEKERLKKLSVTDQLTGLYNHDFFYNRLSDEFNRAVRYKVPLSLIMIDLDNFKMINDTYGHPTGDTALREVAGLLKKAVRKTDVVARYGGEEFAVILPHTSLNGAQEEAERIREMVVSHSYASLKEIVISISAGVAAYPNDSVANAGDLVNLADNGLYEAKRSGKNRVVVQTEHKER
ncbi:MAG: diguanylate cyclase [Thermodesulfobacteriota bacterium]